VRFKVDENLPAEAAAELRNGGHEADTVLDEGLAGAADAELAATIQREGRALVTLDVDFGNLKRYPPSDFAGIVVLRLRNQSRSAVVAAVARLVRWSQTEMLDGRLLSIDETTIRVHD
jgi:predicted nuclease of predicted toxin-antitoxin system